MNKYNYDRYGAEGLGATQILGPDGQPIPEERAKSPVQLATEGLTDAERRQLGAEVARRVSIQRHEAVKAMGKAGRGTLTLSSGKKKHNGLKNKECVCGSRRKFKNCCWSIYA